MKKILITAPARQEPKVFNEYRESIAQLIVPSGYAVQCYYVINNCDELIPCLHEGDVYSICNTDEEYKKTGNDHIWTFRNMQIMGIMRNYTIQYALDNGFDYWFSIDTDLVLHPNVLVELLNADKDIVSEIFWSTSQDVNTWCNAWMCDQATGMPDEWKTPGLYRCGMTGACTLVKRKVLESGVNYSRVPNILYALRGEDRHFCVRAAVHGFELWIDTHYPCDHLYTEQVYQEYMARKEKRLTLADPERAVTNSGNVTLPKTDVFTTNPNSKEVSKHG